MKLLFSPICLLITCLSFAQTPAFDDIDDSLFLKQFYPAAYAQIGHPFQKFSFTENGKTFNNDSLKGKVVFINFWFEACHPCILEMDALNELFEKLKDNKDFMFVSLSIDKIYCS